MTQPDRKAKLVRKISSAIKVVASMPYSDSKLGIVRGIFQTLHTLRKSDIDLLHEHAHFRETVRLKLIEMYNEDGWQGAATFYTLLFGDHL
tara:strand:+ start:2732 stop:3004 length:273 start_codon:yes stop_codon:yes gene_type:complete